MGWWLLIFDLMSVAFLVSLYGFESLVSGFYCWSGTLMCASQSLGLLLNNAFCHEWKAPPHIGLASSSLLMLIVPLLFESWDEWWLDACGGDRINFPSLVMAMHLFVWACVYRGWHAMKNASACFWFLKNMKALLRWQREFLWVWVKVC
jgi:hypothetical protein